MGRSYKDNPEKFRNKYTPKKKKKNKFNKFNEDDPNPRKSKYKTDFTEYC